MLDYVKCIDSGFEKLERNRTFKAKLGVHLCAACK